MSNMLPWTRLAEPLQERPNPLEDYQRHLGIAEQIMRVTNALSQIAPEEISRNFTTDALTAAQGDTFKYALVGGIDNETRSYDLKIVSRGNNPKFSPSVARLFMPKVFPDLDKDKIASDLYTIENWEALARERAEKAKESGDSSEEPLFPRLAYRMPVVLLQGDASPYRTVWVEGNDAMKGFNVQVKDFDNLRRRANIEESLAVMSEIEGLWPSLTTPEQPSTESIMRKFPNVAIDIVKTFPKTDGLKTVLQSGGSNVTGILEWALNNCLQTDSTQPDNKNTYGVFLLESSPGCVERFLIHRTN